MKISHIMAMVSIFLITSCSLNTKAPKQGEITKIDISFFKNTGNPAEIIKNKPVREAIVSVGADQTADIVLDENNSTLHATFIKAPSELDRYVVQLYADKIYKGSKVYTSNGNVIEVPEFESIRQRLIYKKGEAITLVVGEQILLMKPIID